MERGGRREREPQSLREQKQGVPPELSLQQETNVGPWRPFGGTHGGSAGGQHNLIMCFSHTELPEEDARAYWEQRVFLM